MAFTAALSVRGTTAVIELEGDLDSGSAAAFREKIEEATGKDVGRLVLDLSKLQYMSSAGLRGLVFARQKMGSDINIVLVGTNPSVGETIRLTGFDHSVTLSDRVPD